MSIPNASMFLWHSFDARSLLPVNWASTVVQFALANATQRLIAPTSVTSREGEEIDSLITLTVGGQTVRQGLPWLFDLYETAFKDLAQRCTSEPLFVASDDRYGVNLNVQRGSEMRYEAHVDSNPVEGLLYATSHPEGTGGELVVSNNINTFGISTIDNNCSRIYPAAGHLVFFDARKHAHYVAPLRATDAIRVVVAMNFYAPSCPESARPADLNRHLGIE